MVPAIASFTAIDKGMQPGKNMVCFKVFDRDGAVGLDGKIDPSVGAGSGASREAFCDPVGQFEWFYRKSGKAHRAQRGDYGDTVGIGRAGVGVEGRNHPPTRGGN